MRFVLMRPLTPAALALRLRYKALPPHSGERWTFSPSRPKQLPGPCIRQALGQHIHASLKTIFCRVFALALLLSCAGPLAAHDAPPRVASINLCTDQLLLALADPEQIVGLSPYARDPARSWAADRAKNHRVLSGTAEDVLALKPDWVFAGRYTKRATRELLKGKGIPIAEFDAVRSLDEAKGQISRAGDVLGHPERAQNLNAALDFMTIRVLARRFTATERAIVQRAHQDFVAHYEAHLDAATQLLAVGESKVDQRLPVAKLAALTMVANQIFSLDEALNK